MKKSLTRAVTLFLVLAMLLSAMPFAFAAEGDTEPPVSDPAIVNIAETGRKVTEDKKAVTVTLEVRIQTGSELVVNSWGGDATGTGNAGILTATENKDYNVTANVTYKPNGMEETVTRDVSTTVKVTEIVAEAPATKVESVTLDKASAVMEKDDTLDLVATVVLNPADATDVVKTVTWSSSDPTVASVDANGRVTAHKAGPATITATSDADNTKKASCEITVEGEVALTVENISVSKGSRGTLKAVATGLPKDATAIKYDFDKTSAAIRFGTEDGGDDIQVYGEKEGIADVKVTLTYKHADGTQAEPVVTTAQVSVYMDHEVNVTVKDGVKVFHFEQEDVFSYAEYDEDDGWEDLSISDILYPENGTADWIEFSTTTSNITKIGDLNKSECAYDALQSVKFTLNGKQGTQKIYYEIFEGDLVLAAGNLYITSGDSDVEWYKTSNDTAVTFDEDDFQAYWESERDSDYETRLDYVKFTVSSRVPESGELYTSNTSGKKTVTSTMKFEYRYTSGNNYDLDTVTYVPDGKDDDYVEEIDFRAYDSEGNYVDGTVTIDVSGSAYWYEIDNDEEVTFDEEDFQSYWEEEKSDRYEDEIDYVKFYTGYKVPENGKLYTTDSSKKSVSSSMEFEYEAGYSADYDLDEVTYVPDGKADGYVETIPFRAYDSKGNYVDGKVTIAVGSGSAGTNISSRGVVFGNGTKSITDLLMDEFEKETDEELEYVEFELPEVEDGRLYYNFDGILDSDLVDDDEKYYTDPGKNDLDLDKVCFIPAAGAKGKITIEYTAYGNKEEYEGELVLNVQLKNKSVKFTDVNASSFNWAADAVDFMYYEGVVNGTNSANTKYSPASNITRGDFMLMLYRAFLKADHEDDRISSNFSDVKMGTSAYSKETYQAVGVAKALGIAKGNGGKYRPTAPISREEAMLLIFRTLDELDIELEYESTKSTSSFTDYSKVSSWAKEAIADLIDHGIVVGSNGKINPSSNITRAEMAVILHRVLTY